MNTLDIIKSDKLTFEQKVISLARIAENSVNVLNIDKETQKLRDSGIICDLFEGNAPYRPRYIVPDYEKFMREGCKFLDLKPPSNIWEATNNLLIFYKHVPSITTMPVYIGNIDILLEPFIKSEDEAYLAIKLFLKHIDSTITDSFCHANIGPLETKAGLIILKVMKELQLPTPNLTLKYDINTSEKLALESISTSLVTAKPSFANNNMFTKDFKGNYGIVSCYNGLKIGGGAHTLVRVRLSKTAKMANSIEDYFTTVLPYIANNTLKYIDERIRFLVEESNFFETNFLVKEGFISKDNFHGLFGIVGLAECVNELLENKEKYGHSQKANELGLRIIQELTKIIEKHKNNYCKFTNGNHLLHSQVGIETDFEDSPGCRIPVGEEPHIFDHIVQSAPFHKYFPTGIGDIFTFDDTFKKNPSAILDIIKGGFAQGLRFFSLYGNDNDVVRVTGYLVKKSEIAKLEQGKAVLRDTTVLGKGAKDNAKALDRRLRTIDESRN